MVLVIAVEPGQDEVSGKDVSERSETRRAAPPAMFLVAGLLAAIAGFATVYVSFAPSDNGPAEGSMASAPSEGAGSCPLAGLNKGAMAALLVRAKPLDVPAIEFVDGDGATKSLADFKGKVVLLNIWASWCVPCREEMPALDKLEQELGGKDFAVIAVNIDKGGPDKARDFLVETGATHLGLYTDPTSKMFAVLKTVGMPTTLVLDRDGKEIGRLVGPADWSSPEAKRAVEAAIAAKPAAS
jgi:thiol-disulfide isomerase/thioredoxin